MTRQYKSVRAQSIQPSATLELAARASQMRADGVAVLNLSVGEPDYPTPEPVVAAAHRALEEGHFKYTPTPGIPPLRRAIAEVYGERLRQPLTPDMVMVTNGAKQALYNAMATVTDPGDRVGVLRPYWVTYVEQAHALGCEPVVIDCPRENNFRPDPRSLQRALDEGLRVLVVNSPSNPTGAAYGVEDWRSFLEAVAATETLILSDEIYEDIVYGGEGHVSPLHVRPDLADRTCVVSGFSKSFAMTGWRAGFSIAPLEWTRGMSALQSHTTSNINAVTQQAVLEAIAHRELVLPMVEGFARRRERVLARLAEIPGVTAHPPEGTFYLYVDVSAHLGAGKRDHDIDAMAARLLEEERIAVVPGSAFGDGDHLRISFAASEETLDAAFTRLAQALA